MARMSRRSFAAGSVGGALWALTGRGAWGAGDAAAKTTQKNAKGFYTIGKRGGRWWLLTPEREAMFSVGLNHIDAATLRYDENAAIWREKYGNSQKRWLTEAVGPNLRKWGFNTVGWVQEVVTRDETNRSVAQWTKEAGRA